MSWSLDWFAAEKLARSGAQIRRVSWTDHWLVFQSPLWMYTTAAGSRVAATTDFGGDEFNARDWTDQPYGADVCGATPGYNTTPITYGSWTTAPIFTPPPPPGFPSS